MFYLSLTLGVTHDSWEKQEMVIKMCKYDNISERAMRLVLTDIRLTCLRRDVRKKILNVGVPILGRTVAQVYEELKSTGHEHLSTQFVNTVVEYMKILDALNLVEWYELNTGGDIA